MKNGMILALVASFLGSAAFLGGAAMAKKPPRPPCAPPAPALFLAPMGEPFRGLGGVADQAKRWFQAADRDADGRLNDAEWLGDADRFFNILDKDLDGQLLPDEVAAYEQDIAPEIATFRRAPAGAARVSTLSSPQRTAIGNIRQNGAGLVGAGRYSFLNIPNPVVSADSDFNRAIARSEFLNAAGERFRLLNPDRKVALALADLPVLPGVAAAAPCVPPLPMPEKQPPPATESAPKPKP